jgi:hypothetical protein
LPGEYRKPFEEGLNAARHTSRKDALLQGAAIGCVLGLALFVVGHWYWKIAVFLVGMFVLSILIPAIKRRRRPPE